MARAARAAGTIMCLSTLATSTPAEVAEVGGPRWFQLYVLRDEGVTRDLIAQARDCGFSALVLTIDAPVRGNRERDSRTGFAIPRRSAGRVARPRRADAARGVRSDLAVAHLARPRADRRRGRAAAARQGRAHRRGRAPGLRARRGGDRRLEPRRPPARRRRRDDRRAARGRRGGRRHASRCWSTAGSAAAPTSSRRSRSAPAPCSAGRAPLWGLAVDGEAGARDVLRILQARDAERTAARRLSSRRPPSGAIGWRHYPDGS